VAAALMAAPTKKPRTKVVKKAAVAKTPVSTVTVTTPLHEAQGEGVVPA
jgi:hypothetical protein